MARVTMIAPETADAETRRVYDGVLEQWGRISNFSQVLAHQPAALQGLDAAERRHPTAQG